MELIKTLVERDVLTSYQDNAAFGAMGVRVPTEHAIHP